VAFISAQLGVSESVQIEVSAIVGEFIFDESEDCIHSLQAIDNFEPCCAFSQVLCEEDKRYRQTFSYRVD
jgi:hypothetical protein